MKETRITQSKNSETKRARLLAELAIGEIQADKGQFAEDYSLEKLIRELNEEAEHNRQLRASDLLDEMTSYLLSGNEIAFSDLILDWHRENLECRSVPRPKDSDHLSLAIKASVLERLAEVLNLPPHNGNQIPAPWSKGIGALDKPLKLQSERLLEGEDYCAAFQKRNLIAVSNFMCFI